MDAVPPVNLLERYSAPAPRYTSYPPAPHFRSDFDRRRWTALLESTNTSGAPLSLYIHLPFCRHLCFYCGCTKIVTARREAAGPYVETLAREFDLLLHHVDRKRPLAQLHLGGGTPTFLTPEIQERLLEALASRFAFLPAEEADYGLEADPRDIPPGTLVRFHARGFRRLSLGVQDLDPRVQEAIHRIQPPALAARVIEEARALGYRSVNIDLVLGLPHQTAEGFEATLDRVLAWRPERLALFHYAHLPEIFPAQRAIDSGALPSPGEKYRLLSAAVARLAEAGYVHIGLDHFALPDDELARAARDGTLHRNFQGYSTRGGLTLLAAGLSAISDIGTAYAQNEKSLDGWSHAVAEGRLPLARGLELDPDDRVRRRVIMALMCGLAVRLGEVIPPDGRPFWEYFAAEREALEPLARDGLVEVSEEEIRVSALGRFFVRHVARVFDARERRVGNRGQPRYSKVL